MDSDKLKQMFPFLKNVDFEDSGTKRKFGLGIACAIMALLVLMLAIASSAKKKQQQQGKLKPDIEQTQTEPQQPEQKTELLEIPAGEGEDILDYPNMISARERQRSSRGSNLKDLYERTTYGDEDPLANIGEEEEDTKPATRKEEMARMRARFGGGSQPAAQDPAAETQTPVAPKTKKINRSGPSTTAQQQPRPQPKPAEVQEREPEPEPESVDEPEALAAPKTVRKSGGISSLDDWGTVDGIGGLDAEEQYVTVDASKPVKVMFVREQKITSGQRVSLRLLDDIAADGILIPKNTHLSAQCWIGERLELRVNNIEINGKIIYLGYTAFDNDGNQGLYCPETTERKAQKQATDRAGSMGQSILQSVLPGFAGQIVSSGSSIVKSATGKISAQISAGYTFFLLKDEY